MSFEILLLCKLWWTLWFANCSIFHCLLWNGILLHVDIYSEIWSVKCFTECFLKCGRVYSVKWEITLVVSTEHFSFQESYSVFASTKPIFNGVWSLCGATAKTAVSVNKLPCIPVETAAVLCVEEAGSSETLTTINKTTRLDVFLTVHHELTIY